jgi:hypothetical protein
MEIREATESDIPKIVVLLKASLGEDLIPKSERYWRWKHIDNPFGQSPVLLCWEGNELIGVRAFMRWNWILGGKVFRALRAVDTATHPEFQGKGIFKRLTLALVDHSKLHGYHFIFNTPNGQSKPGYLKMGWEVAGRLPVTVVLIRPLRVAMSAFSKTNLKDVPESFPRNYLTESHITSLPGRNKQNTATLTTDISPEFLKWRYVDVPVAKYDVIEEERDGSLVGIIIVRLKQTRFGRELRITDVFYNGSSPGSRLVQNLREYIKLCEVDYCTMSGTGRNGNLLSALTSIRVPFGPIVTIKNVSLENLSSLQNFKSWSPSIGDLELF